MIIGVILCAMSLVDILFLDGDFNRGWLVAGIIMSWGGAIALGVLKPKYKRILLL